MSARLTNLPTELISRIIELADPSTHLNIACTCRRLEECSTSFLQRHKTAYRKYRVASDLDPSTIPTLLRSAAGLGDPLEVWHVRGLEIWGTRENWDEWVPYVVKDHPADGDVTSRRAFFDQTYTTKWSLPRDDLRFYLGLLRERLFLSEDELDMARVELSAGNDSAMQMLLIALCPRLKSLKYILNQHDSHQSLRWLSKAIARSWLKESWAPGLTSLEEVAVGAGSGTWFSQRSGWHRPVYFRSVFTAILKLPSIKSAYFRDVSDEVDGDDHSDTFSANGTEDVESVALTLPAGCSSVEHLYLDQLWDVEWELREALTSAPKALKTLSLRASIGDINNPDNIVENTINTQFDSLESLMFYNASAFNGYRCTLYELGYEINVSELERLRQIHVNIADLITSASYPFDEGNLFMPDLWKDPGQRHRCFEPVVEAFPESLEVLVLGSHDELKGEGLEMSEAILTALVESGRYPALKAIFIEEIQPGGDVEGQEGNTAFRKLAEVGWERGVDVHVNSNPHPPRHVLEFSTPPEVTTNPIVSAGDGHKKFDPFSGCWIRTD